MAPLPEDIFENRLYSYGQGSLGSPTFITAHGIYDSDMSYHKSFFDRKKVCHWPSTYLPRSFESCGVLAARFNLQKMGQDIQSSLEAEAGGWLHALVDWQEKRG